MTDTYFEWLCQKIGYISVGRCRYSGFLDLLTALHQKQFIWSRRTPRDENREEDGLSLRNRYFDENEVSWSDTQNFKDLYENPQKPCSILEMMVALAIRCEEHIMGDPDIGDRTDKWFWDMVKSLGLYSMRGTDFDAEKTNQILEDFLYRNYSPDGEGSLFTVKDCPYNFRETEIWYQMCWYLDLILGV